MNDSSEEEDKATRKQIRKVMNKESLSRSTVQAEKDERERKERIADRQKKVKLKRKKKWIFLLLS